MGIYITYNGLEVARLTCIYSIVMFPYLLAISQILRMTAIRLSAYLHVTLQVVALQLYKFLCWRLKTSSRPLMQIVFFVSSEKCNQ